MNVKPTNRTGNRTQLEKAFDACKSSLTWVLVVSCAVNLLMLAQPIYMLQVFNRVLPSHSYETLVFMTLLVGIAFMVMGLLFWLRSRLLGNIARWLSEDLSKLSLNRAPDQIVQGDPYGTHSLKDLGAITQFIGSKGIIALCDAPWIPIYVFVIFLLHPFLGIIALVGTSLLLALGIINESITREKSIRGNRRTLEGQSFIDTAARDAATIQSMGMMDGIMSKWGKSRNRAGEHMTAATETQNQIQSIGMSLRMILQTVILGAGAYLVLEKTLTPGGMIAGSILMARAMAPLMDSIGTWKQFTNARLSYRRLNKFFELPDLREHASIPTEPEGYLRVEGVFYTPDPRSKMLVENVAFELKPGEIMVILGPTGAGKSVLGRLLTGVIRPVRGNVRLDGADIFHWERSQVGKYIGYMPQSIRLFPGTVADNIARLGDVDEAKVVEAAKLANVHDMILHLKNGYETEIKEDGSGLSGGEIQGIGFARALYGNPKLVVLDEPSLNMDEMSAIALSHTLNKLKEKETSVVLITHRFDLINHADKAVVMRLGRMHLCGDAKEVLGKITRAPIPNKG